MCLNHSVIRVLSRSLPHLTLTTSTSSLSHTSPILQLHTQACCLTIHVYTATIHSGVAVPRISNLPQVMLGTFLAIVDSSTGCMRTIASETKGATGTISEQLRTLRMTRKNITKREIRQALKSGCGWLGFLDFVLRSGGITPLRAARRTRLQKPTCPRLWHRPIVDCRRKETP